MHGMSERQISKKKEHYVIFEQPHIGVKQSMTMWQISSFWNNRDESAHSDITMMNQLILI